MNVDDRSVRIGLFCGSAGRSGAAIGANRAALVAVGDALSRQGAACVEAGDVADVPAFRAEEVDDAPPSVVAMRAVFESVDAVILATPEFGGGAAGAAKNALDWMVGSGSLYQRPCAVVSAGTTGGSNSIEQIVRTLTWQGAFVVGTLGIATPSSKRDDGGRFTDTPTLERLSGLVDELLRSLAIGADALAARATKVVRSFGIDPERRSGR